MTPPKEPVNVWRLPAAELLLSVAVPAELPVDPVLLLALFAAPDAALWRGLFRILVY